MCRALRVLRPIAHHNCTECTGEVKHFRAKHAYRWRSRGAMTITDGLLGGASLAAADGDRGAPCRPKSQGAAHSCALSAGAVERCYGASYQDPPHIGPIHVRARRSGSPSVGQLGAREQNGCLERPCIDAGPGLLHTCVEGAPGGCGRLAIAAG